MMKTRSKILLIVGVTAVTLWSTPLWAILEDVVSLKIRATESGVIEDLVAKSKTDVKADTDLNFNLSGPVLVKLDGRVPMILVPIQQGQTDLKLNPPTYKEAAGVSGQREISFVISEVMISIQAIQKDIAKKNYDQAMFKADELKRKYPDVAFIDFIRGSTLFLQGKKDEARKVVQKALEVHPNYQEGKDFLKALGGPAESGGQK